jgi:endonuclease YncB( thermonuclease family)
MLKKILYGLGGIFLLFIVIGILAPTPKPEVVQSTEQVRQLTPENTDVEATTSVPVAAKSESQKPTEAKAVQSVTSTTKPAPQYTYYSVTSVVDGDTVKVNINGTVETLRLIGMDTPETVDPRKPVQCFGKEASNKAKELLVGTKVRLEKDSTQGELDKYGRTLAYIYREDGLFYNKYMIEQGYAHEYTYNTSYKYQAEFKAAQKTAQENQRGLWSPTTCNGDTTSSSTTTTQSSTTQSAGKYYTSSHYSAQYYYPESCDGWKSLSTKYLVSFNTLNELLAKYQRTLSPQCQ